MLSICKGADCCKWMHRQPPQSLLGSPGTSPGWQRAQVVLKSRLENVHAASLWFARWCNEVLI